MFCLCTDKYSGGGLLALSAAVLGFQSRRAARHRCTACRGVLVITVIIIAVFKEFMKLQEPHDATPVLLRCEEGKTSYPCLASVYRLFSVCCSLAKFKWLQGFVADMCWLCLQAVYFSIPIAAKFLSLIQDNRLRAACGGGRPIK